MQAFKASYPAEYCRQIFRCCTFPDAIQLFHQGNTKACPESITGQLEITLHNLGAGLTAVTYDPERAGRCLARLRTLTCADLVRSQLDARPTLIALHPPLECEGVFRLAGGQPQDAPCVLNEDCAAGLGCKLPGPGLHPVCRPRAEVMGQCLDCPAGTRCNSGTKGECASGLADGAKCDYLHNECLSGLCWRPEDYGPSTCGAPPGTCAKEP